VKLKFICYLLAFLAVGRLSRAATIIDTLGTATASSTFDIHGTFGQGIGSGEVVGPAFTLSAPTLITEIGGLIGNCFPNAGVYTCSPFPFVVNVVGSNNDVPDVSKLLASILLPAATKNPFIYYQSVNPNLILGSGTYFALFTSLFDSNGVILGGASNGGPNFYLAGQLQLGILFSGLDPRTTEGRAAVRILGEPVPEPSQFVLMVVGGTFLYHVRNLFAGRS
jgi:hypothetical protein